MNDSKLSGAWWGSRIGDALAMPAHWYYHRDWIQRDYGTLEHYATPLPQHPDSILWRSSYQSTGPKDDILHDQARYWGQREVHYHRSLRAGENTLNLQIAALLAESLITNNGYHREAFAERYIQFMLTPGSHRDTYVEEYHRAFFQNYAKGKSLDRCGIDDGHIGGLATLAPLILWYRHDRARLVEVIAQHVQLTHKNKAVLQASLAYAQLALLLLEGKTMEQAMRELGDATHPAFGLPYARWSREEEETSVIGKRFSPACYIADAFPATLFLAVKYEKDMRAGLLANVHLGGDNCHRGVVLGTLLGAACGMEAIPPEWITKLHSHAEYQKLLSGFNFKSQG